MYPRRKNRLIVVLLLLTGVILTTSLILYALRSNIDLFYTPTDLLYGKSNQPKPEIGQRLRLGGMVETGSVIRDPQSLKVSFRVYDLNSTVEVEYEGILPDLFREEQSVVVQGVLMQPDRVAAQEVLAKHDENYTPPEVAEAMQENHTRPTWAYSLEEKAKQQNDGSGIR